MTSAINVQHDAFGASILDFHLKGRSVQMIERDDNYVEVENMGGNYFFAPFRRWPLEEKAAAKLVSGRVLDVGCGAGRWCLEMQKRGRKATGIDNSPLAVETCRLRGVKDARVLALRDAAKLRPMKFDSVVMMGHNFGLFGGLAQARRALKQLDAVTAPGARIFAQTFNPYLTDNPLHLSYHRRNRKRGRLGGQIRMRCRYKNIVGPWFDYLFAPKEEIKLILRGSAWELERTLKGKGLSFVAVMKKRSVENHG